MEENGGGSGKEGSAVEAEQEAWVLQTDAYKAFSHPPKLNFNKISSCTFQHVFVISHAHKFANAQT